MSEYTPTTEQVRDLWISGLFEGIAGDDAIEDANWDEDRRAAQFNRWLAAHDAEVRATELDDYAAAIDREHAEDTSRIRVTNVRCDMCGIRYEERDEYSCDGSRHPHEYDEGEMSAARVVILEPTWDGDQARNRAAAIREMVTTGVFR